MPRNRPGQTRREFLKSAGALTAGAILGPGLAGLPCLAAEPDEGRRKPNVVFVFADQLRSQALGCYGDKQAETPNLDRLAAEGARFTNALSTWPVCSPFRAMLLTGRYPMSNGVIANGYRLWDGQHTIGSVFKTNGYATGYIGKWHLDGDESQNVSKDRRQGFDYWVSANQYPMHGRDAGGNQTWRPEQQTDDALRYIKSNKDKPFCLVMSWLPPHDPYIAPERFMKMFAPEKMQFRPNVAEKDLVREQLEKHPLDPSGGGGAQRVKWRERLDSDNGVREILSGYYAATAGLDVCIGRVMNALDEAGIADDTIFVFTSDHGDMLGSHRMCLKQEPFEESISIPFIVRFPGRVPKGTVTDALLTPIDMMPTLLGLAGVPCPDTVEGVSLADAAKGKRSDQQDPVLSPAEGAALIMKMLPGGNPWVINAATEWRGVHTKTHTYARLADSGPWLLYDNRSDPYQMKNLVNDPAHKKLQDELEATLQRLLKKAHDPFDSDKIRQIIAQQSKKELTRGTL